VAAHPNCPPVGISTLHVDGGGTVRLAPGDFVGAGGQGAVWARGGTAYKVFSDPTAMIPEGKVRELRALPPEIFCRPERLLRDDRGTVVGYTTRFVPDAHVLCRLFARSARERLGLDRAGATDLVAQMRIGFERAHAAGVVLVDPNELNFLVDASLRRLTFIDVDAARTPSYPGTAIMETILDRHMPAPGAFDEGTDWFAFAVVSFQLLIGVHPYRGVHPTLKSLDARMAANASVFDPRVKRPPAAYDLDLLPTVWRDWYFGVFELGERGAPPTDGLESTRRPARSQPRPVAADPALAGTIAVRTLANAPAPVLGVLPVGGRLVVRTATAAYVDGRRACALPSNARLALSEGGRPVAGWLDDGALRLIDILDDAPIPTGIRATALSVASGRLLVRCGADAVAVSVIDAGGSRVAVTRARARALGPGALLFPGGIHQDLLGAAWLTLFDGAAAHQVRCPALDGHRVVDAHHDRGVVAVRSQAAAGEPVRRTVLRFDPDYGRFTTGPAEDADRIDLRVTPSGTVLAVEDSGDLRLLPAQPDDPRSRIVPLPPEVAGARLTLRGSEVLAAQGSRVYSIRML
jgi:hypothetical protein